ncbi:MAG TPA: GGDEF domain-containing protein [Candidatus Dormibacteraeota bacterium]|nr:GGDEF domain-containing protein [Candidatus Dormibacteraeota bacterium]
MPVPGEAPQPQPSPEDSFLDLLIETLEGLDVSVRGQFLRQYFRTIAQIDLTESQSNEYWQRILARRRELAESLGRPVSLKTAMVDVLATTNFFRVPILMEYEEFKKLQVNAATDALTGLYNRRLFDEYSEKELNRAKRYNQQLAFVILDVHKLKEVNDRRGHLQGDQILQLSATMLRKTMRASDFAFRIGGDEFALLLPETDPEQANTLCRRIRAQFENDIREMKLDIGVTLDFGIAVHPQDGDSKRTLLGLADKRLYELKNMGREAGPTPFSRRGRTLETFPPRGREESRETSAESAPREIPPKDPREESASREAPPLENPPAERKPFVRSAPPPAFPAAQQPPRAAPPVEHRKFERVSLAGTKAYAVLAEATQRHATVVDLSYGGVALLVEKPEELPAQFNAILHVPILPPVRVVLHKAYTQRVEGGRSRVGCSFVS